MTAAAHCTGLWPCHILEYTHFHVCSFAAVGAVEAERKTSEIQTKHSSGSTPVRNYLTHFIQNMEIAIYSSMDVHGLIVL